MWYQPDRCQQQTMTPSVLAEGSNGGARGRKHVPTSEWRCITPFEFNEYQAFHSESSIQYVNLTVILFRPYRLYGTPRKVLQFTFFQIHQLIQFLLIITRECPDRADFLHNPSSQEIFRWPNWSAFFSSIFSSQTVKMYTHVLRTTTFDGLYPLIHQVSGVPVGPEAGLKNLRTRMSGENKKNMSPKDTSCSISSIVDACNSGSNPQYRVINRCWLNFWLSTWTILYNSSANLVLRIDHEFISILADGKLAARSMITHLLCLIEINVALLSAHIYFTK